MHGCVSLKLRAESRVMEEPFVLISSTLFVVVNFCFLVLSLGNGLLLSSNNISE